MSVLDKFLKKVEEKKSEKTKVSFSVVGVTFENRQDTLKKYLEENIKTGRLRDIQLILEDNNKYDKNAIAVYICGDVSNEMIGYISKDANIIVRDYFSNIENVQVKSIGKTEKGQIGISIDIFIKKD